MMSTKHTPGPWKVERYTTKSGLVQTIIQSEKNNVCRMDISGRNYQSLTADAHLIAAAPGLLAVAEKADELIQMFVGTNSPDEPFLIYSLPREVQDLVYELMDMSNRAIAAAKG